MTAEQVERTSVALVAYDARLAHGSDSPEYARALAELERVAPEAFRRQWGGK
ncbi:MAG TPA: hypothetical protein VFB66_22225 [Tepidisphaeraceae bacterium]|nr:hypothetical protein [Tepidisphaeraceae bacterium]